MATRPVEASWRALEPALRARRRARLVPFLSCRVAIMDDKMGGGLSRGVGPRSGSVRRSQTGMTSLVACRLPNRCLPSPAEERDATRADALCVLSVLQFNGRPVERREATEGQST